MGVGGGQWVPSSNVDLLVELLLIGDRRLQGAEEVQLAVQHLFDRRTPFLALREIVADEHERQLRVSRLRLHRSRLQDELQRVVVGRVVDQ